MTRAAPPNSVIRSDIVSIIIPDKVGQKIYKKVLMKKIVKYKKIMKKEMNFVKLIYLISFHKFLDRTCLNFLAHCA